MYKIGFLGLGKMGSSILKGILSKELYQKREIAFFAPSVETKTKYQEFGINLVKDEKELFKLSNIVIMAIKPQQYDLVLGKIKDLDFNDKIIISLAPGKTISYLSKNMKGAEIVRVMPNTPALVGKGMTTIAFQNEEISIVMDIFSSIGKYVIVKEKQIDEAIPLNGSMPAYLFEFVKAFIEKGMEYGIPKEDAYILALNAIIGSCELALNSNDDIDTLINNVCSKGGSTIEGLNVLRNNHVLEVISMN